MSTLTGLRAALTAARPTLTGEQQDAADALLVAITPRMDEPTWPGYVMARCPDNNGEAGDRIKLHVRLIGTGDPAGWECAEICIYGRFRDLRDPRPLTPAERAEYGIPGECEQPHAEPITDELVDAVRVLEVLLAAGWRAPERGAE